RCQTAAQNYGYSTQERHRALFLTTKCEIAIAPQIIAPELTGEKHTIFSGFRKSLAIDTVLSGHRPRCRGSARTTEKASYGVEQVERGLGALVMATHAGMTTD